MPIIRILTLGVVISLALGVAGGFVAARLSAPFYFGFLFAFTLSGLITMFVLAAKMARPPGR